MWSVWQSYLFISIYFYLFQLTSIVTQRLRCCIIISGALTRRNSITEWCFDFIHTLPLSFPSCLSMFSGASITVRPKSSSTAGCYLRLRAGVGVGQILPSPSPTPTPAKTVDYDQLQLRSRLRLRNPGGNHGCRWPQLKLIAVDSETSGKFNSLRLR